jgi:predicted adenylyl cyclase CyaB
MEIETKFKIPSADEVRLKLAKIGARPVSRDIEKDTYYATPEGKGLTAVRLRSIGRRGLFTIKSTPAAGSQGKPGLKVLEEIQVEIDDASRFGRMLEMMGFVAQFRKEKIRESYDWNGLPIFLDIEAPEDGIRAAASALGLDMSQASGETYMQIFSRYKVARNVPDLELTF